MSHQLWVHSWWLFFCANFTKKWVLFYANSNNIITPHASLFNNTSPHPFITMNKLTPTTNISDDKALYHPNGLIGCIGIVDGTYIPLSMPGHCDNIGVGLQIALSRNRAECAFGTLTHPFTIIRNPSQNYNVTVDCSLKIVENTVNSKISDNK